MDRVQHMKGFSGLDSLPAKNGFIAPYASDYGPTEELLKIHILGYRYTPEVLAHPKGSRIYFMVLMYEKGRVEISGVEYPFPALSMVLIEPEIPYRFCDRDGSAIYSWVRMSGQVLDNWLQYSGIEKNHPFRLGSASDFENGLLQINREMRHPLGADPGVLRLLVQGWLLQIGRAAGLHAEKLPPPEFLNAKHYIENSFTGPVRLRDVQKASGMSQTRLCVGFKKYFNCTPMEYMTHLRMHYAVELMMESSSLRVSEVCVRCGYSDPLYFGKVFRKTFGRSPSKYREQSGEPE